MMITHMDSYRTYTLFFISALMLVSTWDEERSCHYLLDTQTGSHKLRFFILPARKKNVSKIQFALLLRGNFFQCHVFAMKSVQNLKYFSRLAFLHAKLHIKLCEFFSLPRDKVGSLVANLIIEKFLKFKERVLVRVFLEGYLR